MRKGVKVLEKYYFFTLFFFTLFFFTKKQHSSLMLQRDEELGFFGVSNQTQPLFPT